MTSASPRNRHWVLVTALGFALWLVAFACAGVASPHVTLVFRAIASAFVIATIGLTMWSGPRRLALSPLLHLSLIAIAFYAWFPLVSAAIVDTTVTNRNNDLIVQYVGSRSELLVLGFIVLCAAAHGAVAGVIATKASHGFQGRSDLPPAVGAWAVCGMLGLCAATVAVHFVPALRVSTETGSGREALGAIPVLVAFLAACTVAAWYRLSATRLIAGAAAVGMASFSLLLSNQAPVPLLIVYGAGLLYMALASHSFARGAGLVLSCGALVAVIIVPALAALRPLYQGPGVRIENPGFSDRVSAIVANKFFHRQGISAGCFNVIASRSLDERKAGNPFYFAVAVIPRSVWPDKPNLSRGSDFAELCGETGAYETGHSESITIIGEPILEAGMTGLVVAELTLVALLIAASIIGLAGGVVRLVALAAMYPWLLPVEHPFALYIGNMFKMALIVVFAALLLQLALRRLSAGDGSLRNERQTESIPVHSN